MTNALFQPIQLGNIELKNRIVMPPMTRSRATQPGNSANDMMAAYYAQRASAGLIVAEGTQISPMGQGYAWTPGIYSDEQIAGWKKVTDAVHEKEGVIFAQLWHVGRVTHPDNIGGEQPISSSALKAENVKVFIDNRTDEYGGSIENRLRFLGEVVEAMVEAIGADRVGVRLAPFTSLNGTVDATPVETYTAAAALLNLYKIVYLHIAEVDWDDAPETPKAFKAAVREAYEGVLIYAGKYDSERGEKAVAEGVTDMVGFGRPFVANPDLPARIQNGYPLAAHDPNTLFGGAEKGLTDYPEYAG